MFEELYEPVPDTGKILEKIGLKDLKVRTDVETLDTLIEAFITHIPFENLTVCYERKTPSLGVKDLYHKVIEENRGGYCFELNGLFAAFLQALGFEAYSVAVFVKENVPFLPPLSHRSTVCIIDGEKYFAEVGYGHSMAGFAIPLSGRVKGDYFIRTIGKELTLCKIVDPAREEAAGAGQFVIYEQICKDGGIGRWISDTSAGTCSGDITEVACKEIQMFRDYEAYPVEFVYPNFAHANDPHGIFYKDMFVNFRNPDGDIYMINKDVFRTRTSQGRTEKRIENDEELRSILKEYFHIDLPEKGRKTEQK